MHLVYTLRQGLSPLTNFDKPHVAVLQSGFKNAFRALLSGYARIKRPKHSRKKIYAPYTAILMTVGFLGSFGVGWLLSRFLAKGMFSRIDSVWPTVSLRGDVQCCRSDHSVNHHHGFIACCILHLYDIPYPIMPSKN